MRYLAFGVFLLAAWVLSANTILQSYLAPSSLQTAERIAIEDDAGTLPEATAALPVLTAPAMTQLAAATQPATTAPANSKITESLAISAEKTDTPVVTAPITSPVRLASAAPTIGGADISDAAVIAKADEPASGAPAKAAPMPRVRQRHAAVPLPRPRPEFIRVAPVSVLDRLFGVR